MRPRPPDVEGGLTFAHGVASRRGKAPQNRKPSKASSFGPYSTAETAATLRTAAGFELAGHGSYAVAQRLGLWVALTRRWRRTLEYEAYLRGNGLRAAGFVHTNFAERFMITLASIRILRPGRFVFADEDGDGEVASGVAMAVLRDWRIDEGELEHGGIEDIVAWRRDDPELVFSYLGRTSLLDAWRLTDAMSLAEPLRVFRSPLEWLQHGGRGVALGDDPASGARRLLEARDFGEVAVPDRVFARRLEKLAGPRRAFLVPKAA